MTYTYGFLLPIKCNKYFVQKAWCHVLVLPSILVNVLEIQSDAMYLLLWCESANCAKKLLSRYTCYWPSLKSRWLILAWFFLVLLWTKAKNEVNIQPFWPNKLVQYRIYFVAKTKSFCAKQSSKSHTGKINLFCLHRQPFRMMDMLHLYCPMNKPYYDKITCSLTTALLDQCSYSTGQN